MGRNLDRPYFNIQDKFGWSNVDKYNLDWLISEQIAMRNWIEQFRTETAEYINWLETENARLYPPDFESIEVNPDGKTEVIRNKGKYIEIYHTLTVNEITTAWIPLLKIDQTTDYEVVRPCIMYKEDSNFIHVVGMAKWKGNRIYLNFRGLPHSTVSEMEGKYKIVLQF